MECIWCISNDGNPNAKMQVITWADLNHDDDTQTVIITDIYAEGTASHIIPVHSLAIPPHRMVHNQLACFVTPVTGTRGQRLVTRLVLVDQFKRKYKTEKISFRWIGKSPEPPKP